LVKHKPSILREKEEEEEIVLLKESQDGITNGCEEFCLL
jgi:hypothetical protein